MVCKKVPSPVHSLCPSTSISISQVSRLDFEEYALIKSVPCPHLTSPCSCKWRRCCEVGWEGPETVSPIRAQCLWWWWCSWGDGGMAWSKWRKKLFEKRFHLLSPRLQPVMKTDWGAMMNGNQTFWNIEVRRMINILAKEWILIATDSRICILQSMSALVFGQGFCSKLYWLFSFLI